MGQHCGACESDQGAAEFNCKQELTPVAISAVLFLIGLIFNETLSHTPYQIGEYAVLQKSPHAPTCF